MGTVFPTFFPAIVAARQRATMRKFEQAGANAPERARALQDLGLREDRLFGRLAKAGVVVRLEDGRYFLSDEGAARWRRNARIGVVIALLVIAVGVLVAFGVGAGH